LTAAGHQLAERAIVPDDIYQIRAVVSGWIADPVVQVVLVTGGTGMTGRDSTPEAVRPLLDKDIDGFGELFRMLSWEEIGTSTCNRGRWADWPTPPSFFACRALPGLAAPAGIAFCKRNWTPAVGPAIWWSLLPRLRER
jgi:molybdenum cofactor biosynthesis protein B